MNNDLISRKALKEDLIKFFPTDCLDGIESKTLFNQILTDIENAPTVDTTCPHCDSGYAQGYSDGYLKGIEERPTGKWIKIFENPYTNGYVCPFCGYKIQVTEQFLPKVTTCRGCGAEMIGGEE